MLKKIAVSQVRVGMHLHKLEGPWLAHPFWKTRFVIHNAADLQRLHDSAVQECWINTALGLDLAEAAADDGAELPTPKAAARATIERAQGAAQAAAPGPQAAASGRPPAVHGGACNDPRALSRELREAAAICNRGREAVVSMFNEARMGRTVSAAGCLPLVDDISSSVQRNPGALVSLARLKSADDYSYMHSVAVCALMVALARQLGRDEDGCREAGLAGLMHDIGKALMPLDLLNKPGRLSEPEFAIIRSHPERGVALLQEGQGASAQMLDVVMHHHEKIDGSGYPHKLAGDDITPLARMGAICDVYDAITSNRPYKAGWDPAESIARMGGWQGHFDPPMFDAFVQNLGIYPVGSRVLLESGRLAVVMDQNAQQLPMPLVKAFFCTRSRQRITPQLLDLSAKNCHDRIVGRDSGVHGVFAGLDDLWAGGAQARRDTLHA